MVTTRRTTGRIVPAVVAVLICGAAGAVGSILTRPGLTEWYPSLSKPSFNPPSWVFAPVWTALYALMGIAASLVWQRRDVDPHARPALRLFGLQLGLNALWSGAFFGLRSPLAGLIDIAALWIALVATTLSFARVSRSAALLLLPYLAWTSFAAVLNAAIWRLNQ